VNWAMGFQEVFDYLYLSPTRAPADGSFIAVNKDAFEALSPDLQMAVKVVAETERAKFFTNAMVEDAKALEKMKDYGVQVLPLPKEIEEGLLKVASEFYDEKVAEHGGFYARVVESHRAFKKLCELLGVS